MAIKKVTKAANGLSVAYHQIVKLEVDMTSQEAKLSVSSHPDEEAYLDGLPLVWMWSLGVPVEYLDGSTNLMDVLEEVLVTLTGSPFQGGEIVTDQAMSLETAKIRKNKEINRSRLIANRESFTYDGKEIGYDELSQIDIAATNGIITLTNEMPEGWLGGWKAVDNTYVAIPDVATWVLFYKAIVQQGTNNFNHAQALKLALAAATTHEDVAAIHW